MKCSICGKRANSIKTMGDHYRKKHPSKMKRGKKRKVISGPRLKKFLGSGITKEMHREAVLIKQLSDIEKNILILKYVPYGAILEAVRGY